jgi:hypothetical protein
MAPHSEEQEPLLWYMRGLPVTTPRAAGNQQMDRQAQRRQNGEEQPNSSESDSATMCSDSTLDSRSPSPLSPLRKTRQDPFDSPPIHASPSGARTDRPSRRRFANFLLRYRPRSSSHSQLVSRYYISYIIQRTRPTSMPPQRGSNPSCTTSRLRGDGGDAGTNPESLSDHARAL